MDTAILSIIGLTLGASLQYFFTKHNEDKRHIRELRSKAYMDLLKSVSEYANFRPKKGTKENSQLAEKTANAKARICLYGSTKVIESYSKWEQLGPTMVTSEQRSAFIEMVKNMRADSGGKINVESNDIQSVLLGTN